MALRQHLLLALESGKVYPVTLKNVNPLGFSSLRSKIGLLKTALANFVKRTSNESATCKLPFKFVFYMTIRFRGGYTSCVTPGMWIFVTIVNDWQYVFPGVLGVLDLQLRLLLLYTFYMYICICVSLCNPLDTGSRLGVHKTFRKRSVTTYEHLVCFQYTSCAVGVRFYL